MRLTSAEIMTSIYDQLGENVYVCRQDKMDNLIAICNKFPKKYRDQLPKDLFLVPLDNIREIYG